MSLTCWICQQRKTSNLILLTHRATPQQSIRELLRTVVGIELDKGYATERRICQQCRERLKQSYALWKQCGESYVELINLTGQESEQYFCRICKRRDVDELIAPTCVCDTWNMSVADMIEFLSGVVMLQDDILSSYVCDGCFERLNMCCSFKQQCLEAELSLHSRAVRGWDMMKFEDSSNSKNLIVDLYATAFPRWNTRDQTITHIYCMICSLETPFNLFSKKCPGCQLDFKNFEDIVNRSSENYLELADSETGSVRSISPMVDMNIDEDFDKSDAGGDCLINESDNDVTLFPSTQNQAAVDHLIVHNKPPPDIDNCFEVVENLNDLFQKVRRKGPMCCGCKIFFLSEAELEEHRQIRHVQAPSEMELGFLCEVCTRIFHTNAALKHHELIQKRDTFYYCKMCKHLLVDGRHLTLHNVHIHGNKNANNVEILEKFKSKTVMRYRCKINGCKRMEKCIESFLRHYSFTHKLQLDETEVFSDPTFRVKISVHHCKVNGCNFSSRSLALSIRHCSLHQESTQPTQAVRKRPVHKPTTVIKTRTIPEAPDMKFFTTVDNVDQLIVRLKTDRAFCCGCFTFHTSEEDLQQHVLVVHENNAHSEFKFVCPKCCKGFKSPTAYKRHKTTATRKTFYCCQPCERFLWDLRDVYRHKIMCPHRRNVEDNHQFETITCAASICCRCHEHFDSEANLAEHCEKIHRASSLVRKNMLICNVCNKQFISEVDLVKHQTRTSPQFIYKCKVGQCVFETRNLEKIKTHVVGQIHLDSTGLSVNIYNPNPTQRDCCVGPCFFASDSYDAIVDHVASCHEHVKTYNEINYQDRGFTCVACKKGYDTWYQLYNHVYPKVSLGCRFCGKTVKRTVIEAHQENCPKRVKVRCDICSKEFEAERLLKKHEQTRHVGKCFRSPKNSHGTICNICGLLFTNISTHMLTHSSSRPYKCSLCPLGFKSKQGLDNHGVVHTKIKAFACRYGCDNRYCQSGDRIRHERAVHQNIKPFECRSCSKSFPRERELRLHNRIHTGRRLYPCSKCKASFDKLSEFNEHECDEST